MSDEADSPTVPVNPYRAARQFERMLRPPGSQISRRRPVLRTEECEMVALIIYDPKTETIKYEKP